MSIQSPPPPTCGQFPASFLAVIDQNIESPAAFIVPDPELTFFKEVLGFRDDAIQHTIEDAMKFFNETYCLDFSHSPPTDQNEYFYQSAIMRPARVSDDIDYLVTPNNWIQTGNTRSTCYRVHNGGFQVRFSDDQVLHGSYGGADGKPAGVTDFLVYAFIRIDVCGQSPVIFQSQTNSLFRQAPIGQPNFLNSDLYHRGLGHGKELGFFTFSRDTNNPDQYRLVLRNTFIFPVN